MSHPAILQLVPRAVAWAETQSEKIRVAGARLDAQQLRVATRVGVSRPDLVRICEVARLPRPDDRELRRTAESLGFLGPAMIGITFGYGICVVRGYVTNRLISHECRHVQQYETAGSIAAFLPVYIEQLLTFGYDDAPFEVDARMHECDLT